MTETLKDDQDGIARAAALLRHGRLVAFATETVYGLGADATQAEAVAAIFAAKNRPTFNPLISHYPEAEAAFEDAIPDGTARTLAAAFWPGPLTLVLPRRPASRVASLTSSGLASLAVRVPGHPTARALLALVGRPVAAPSANRSGRVSPTTAAHVFAELGSRPAAVLDCGPCAVGLESTVVDLTRGAARLLRPGGVTREEIEARIGPIGLAAGHATEPRLSPGMSDSHYAPSGPVRLDATEVVPGERLLAFGPPLPGASVMYQLSARSDLTEAAARLFDGLRWLDQWDTGGGIAAMPIPDVGLGRAVNDRLRRAAAPRL